MTNGTIPTTPGLGIQLNPDALHHYTTDAMELAR
jgi:hypothetical protein